VEDAAVAQEIEVTEEQLRDGKRIPLRFVRFQSVNSLHVCVFYLMSTSPDKLCRFLWRLIKEAKMKPESTHSTSSLLEFMGYDTYLSYRLFLTEHYSGS
jgi:hypothetical protein